MNLPNETNDNDIIINDSKLGTKEYWDNFYEKEKNQFSNNSDLIGEIWFGKQIQNKVINYIMENFKSDHRILDVGCGNAAFLISLGKKDFVNLYGGDYSENSIDLARSVVDKKAEKHEKIKDKIHLFVEDINNPLNENCNYYDLIHDKGTMDAFLSNRDHQFSSYFNYLYMKLTKGGTFIITSCNFTRKELETLFSTTNLTLVKELPHKQFTFGGKTGQLVTTLVFRK